MKLLASFLALLVLGVAALGCAVRGPLFVHPEFVTPPEAQGKVQLLLEGTCGHGGGQQVYLHNLTDTSLRVSVRIQWEGAGREIERTDTHTLQARETRYIGCSGRVDESDVLTGYVYQLAGVEEL